MMNKRKRQSIEERKNTIKKMKIQLFRMMISKDKPSRSEMEKLYCKIIDLERPILLKQHCWIG